MNNKRSIILFLIIAFLSIIFIIYSIKKSNELNIKDTSKGKDISKEEYIYKDNLLDLGYSMDEVKKIQTNISNIDVKNYLLNSKFVNLILFMTNPYFKTKNIFRYENYYKNNKNLSIDEVILNVEIGLDNEFYTNINTIDDANNIATLVNKYNKIKDSQEFNDIVSIKTPYSDTGNRKIRSVVYDNLIKMIDDAKKEEIKLFVVSGYRTYNEQNYLFNNSVKKNGLEHALKYSAKPGHSEHELGLAVDFNTTEVSFKDTKEYKWLKQNAYKYGFIERYKENKEYITGYAYEPWHYRYIGIDIASKIFEENITFEEYIVKYSK